MKILQRKAQNFEGEIQKLIERLNYILVDYVLVRQKKSVLFKVVIHRSDGISMVDCEKVTKELKQLLDKLEIDDYLIEVSSPGVERVLKTERELKVFSGTSVIVSYRVNDEVVRQEMVLDNFDKQSVVFLFNDNKIELDIDDIIKIKLAN